MKQHTIEGRNALVTLASREEAESLEQILDGADWSLHVVHTFAEAEAALGSSLFGVVVCGGHFADGRSWKDVLSLIHAMSVPPELVVADRLADETLWAEVLNLGCYDLLAMPFEPTEVLRVLPRAWDFWKRKSARAEVHPRTPEVEQWYEGDRTVLFANPS